MANTQDLENEKFDANGNVKTSVNAQRATLQASGAQTITGNSAALPMANHKEGLITLNCAAASGTTPTCTVKIQTSDDGGTTWYDIPNAAFTQLTGVGSQALQISTFGDTIRAYWTIAGTTPSFTFAVKGVFK